MPVFVYLLLTCLTISNLLIAAELERVHPQRMLIHDSGIGDYLAHDRDLVVHLPAGFDEQPARRYPLLICFDGSAALTTTPGEPTSHALDIDLVHDRLVAENLIDPCVIVAIPNSDPNRRWFELRPQRDGDDGELQRFHAFLVERLLPLLRAELQVAAGWEAVGLQGCSMGCGAASWLMLQHPDHYGFAGCFSGGVWFDDDLPADGGALAGHRYYIDDGAEEGMFRPNGHLRTIAALRKRGWREGVDVAWRVNQGGHRYADWKHGVRSMWLLWRGQPTTPSQLTLHTWFEAAATASDPGADGEHARILARVRDERGFEYHLSHPELRVDAPELVTFSGREPGLPLCQAAGTTTVHCQLGELHAELALRSFEPDRQAELLPLAAAPATGIAIDGNLDDWAGLLRLAEADAGYRFGAVYRDGALYLAVDVDDEHLVAKASVAAWKQDGLELRVDLRPRPRLELGRGMDERFYLHLIALSPSPSPEQIWASGRGGLHRDVSAVCVQRAGGWCCEVAIAAPRPETGFFTWTAARVNLLINDRDHPDGELTRHPWRPDWRWPAHRVGSGILIPIADDQGLP